MISIDLSGKVALITGASQGIGACIARTFHGAGADVILNHPGKAATGADAEVLAGELNAARPDSALVVAADVSNEEQVRAMMESTREWRGGIDFLVNNDVNLTGVFLCCQQGLAVMRDGGAIVSFGSIAAIQGFFGQANYAAAKAGVQSMMRVLSREVARRGIRANAVAPGVIDTSMAATIPESVREEMLKNVPLGRFGTTEEVANVILFLCSPLSSYVTGQTIEINGGWRG